MRKIRRLLSALAIVGLLGALWIAIDQRSGAQAAARTDSVIAAQWSPATMATHGQQQPTNAVATSPSTAVFRQYCIGCHNERMKGNYGKLSLEGLDPADVSSHVETFEKVV